MIEIDGYTIVRPLGSGGMAQVFLAVQQSLGREVALKVLSPGLAHDPLATERFLREARTAAKLHHPHIVTIHDVGVSAGVPYMAMQYEPGGTAAPTEGTPCDPAAALRIVREIAAALDYAHSKGVIHRDVKPENILLRADGSWVLSDFGIARAAETQTALTCEGTSVGTPHYMSPEQLRGDKIEGRSDLYSLGVVLHQLLTARLPFTGSDGWAIGMQHIAAPIPRLPADVAHLQPLLDELMAKDPDQRPPSGADVVRRIERLCAANAVAPTLAVPIAPTRRANLRARLVAPAIALAMRVPRTALSILTLLLLLGGALLWSMERGERPDAPTAAAPVAAVPAAPGAAPAIPARSIAVLPFVNMSSDPEHVYFSDGIAEELLNALVKLPGLKVAGRTSSFAFRDKQGDLREIGTALGVGHILEGSVRRQGARVRITAQLVKADDGFHLWSETYDRDIVDIFALQDEITRAIVSALKVELGAGEAPASAVADLDAYTLYLQARQKLALRGAANMSAAGALFEQAIAGDPGYAPAHAGLGRALALHGTYPYDPLTNPRPLKASEASRRARAAAQQALALDPQNAEAWSVLGTVSMFFDFDWEAAGQAFDRSLALSPNDAEIVNFIGVFYAYTLDPRAEATELRAVALDPLHAVNHHDLSLVYFLRGNFAEALRASDAADALGYYSQVPQGLLVIRLRSLLALGRLVDARQVADRLQAAFGHPDHPMAISAQIQIARATGDPAKAATLLEGLLRRAAEGRGAPMLTAWNLVEAGRPDEAALWVERLVAARTSLLTMPLFVVLPEYLPDSVALRAALDTPELNALFEIRRRNLAKTAENAVAVEAARYTR